MIDKLSLSKEWLEEKRKTHKKDPSIIEGMIHALYLLDQLKLTSLDFIFKGGTSLILLMEKPLRFSVDIDIIVSPETSKDTLESHLSKIIESSEFVRVEFDQRRSFKHTISKAHYKFIYRSNVSNLDKAGKVISNPEREILLDVLFSDNPYPALINTPIRTDWVITQGKPLTVVTPDINSIAGDKLVAFAPNTTGVPFGAGKEKEIIKQLFDVGNLFPLINNFRVFTESYFASASAEMSYRPEREISSVQNILHDTIATAMLIAIRESHSQNDVDSKDKYAEISKGIAQFSHFVFDGRFRVDDAQVASAKAAYLAAALLNGYTGRIEIFNESILLQDYLINHPKYNFLNKRLKYVAKGEALFYWDCAVKLLLTEEKTNMLQEENLIYLPVLE